VEELPLAVGIGSFGNREEEGRRRSAMSLNQINVLVEVEVQ